MEGKGSTHNVANLQQQIKNKNGMLEQIKFDHNCKNKLCGGFTSKRF
jgi:succinate dehydrogenase/fumarate reductase-like Fe-S protein